MRKYQQLFLIVISVLSITILLVYKSENSRLKYVLQVVNFFGRSDIKQIENNTKILNSLFDYENPLPVWQRITNILYAYSTFWHKNQLIQGGEIITIVVSLEHAIINFKCFLQYPGNKLIGGKFAFIRVENSGMDNSIKTTENYLTYNFLCKITKNFGVPENVIFIENETQIKHTIPVRNMQRPLIKYKNLMTVCLDLNTYNSNSIDIPMTDVNLLQFFVSHRFIGVDEFIIYNSNGINSNIKEFLYKNNIKFNVLPYNFPFQLDDKNKNRQIIETDCLLRTSSTSRYTIISRPNNFFYPNSNLKLTNSLIKLLNDKSINTNRFEIKTFSVCSSNSKTTFADNIYADFDKKNDQKFYIYKPDYLQSNQPKTITIDINMGTLHSYMTCSDTNNLKDWRIKVKPEYLNYIKEISLDIKKFI